MEKKNWKNKGLKGSTGQKWNEKEIGFGFQRSLKISVNFPIFSVDFII